VSAKTGAGVAELRVALDRLVSELPAADLDAPVRLWVDRAFTMRGAGLVVTGTLAAGTVRVGDTVELARTGERYVVREAQSLSRHVDEAAAVARVALNLRGASRGDVGRGDALMTPGSYRRARLVDARIRLVEPADLPRELLVHVGTATVDALLRPLGQDTARLTLRDPLPLRVGDRLVLRTDRGVAGGAVLLDVDPPVLDRRGAGRRRAEDLREYADEPDGERELRRRGIVREGTLRAIGVTPPPGRPLVGDWLVAPALAASLRSRLATMVAARTADPAAAPLAVEEARRALDLPDVRLVGALVEPPLTVRNGVIVHGDAPDTLAPAVRDALAFLDRAHADTSFAPLEADELSRHGLGAAEVAAAARAGRVVRLAPDVVLLAGTVRAAVETLAGLAQPFTAGEAREALGTSRKVIVPLLEHLAREGATRRMPDGRHAVTGR
jgi:selenocysteine-specific elongation factor